MPSTLPIGTQTPKEDVRCVCPGEAMALAAPGRQVHAIPKRLRKKRKPSVRFWMGAKNDSKDKLQTYLVPLTVSLLKVGCRIESSLCHCWLREILAYCCLRELPSKASSTYSLHASAVEGVAAMIRFDSDSFPIGVDCHASQCMANTPHLFKDLKLTKVEGTRVSHQGHWNIQIQDQRK